MRSALALLGGAILYGLAFPPFDLSALGWVALVPLLVVIRGRSAGAAFLYGMLSGYASAVVLGLSWLMPAELNNLAFTSAHRKILHATHVN